MFDTDNQVEIKVLAGHAPVTPTVIWERGNLRVVLHHKTAYFEAKYPDRFGEPRWVDTQVKWGIQVLLGQIANDVLGEAKSDQS